MTTGRSTEDRISSWLLETAPSELPDRVLDATFERTRSMSQVSRGLPWRNLSMRPLSILFATGAVAFVLIAVVAVGGFGLVSRPGGVGGGPTPSAAPTASPATSPSAAASAAASFDTSTWSAFTSTRYGYAMSYPGTWSTQPADHDWSLGVDRSNYLSTAADAFMAPSNALLFTVFAAPIPAGMSGDAWITSYLGSDSGASPNPCSPRSEDVGPIVVDGHPATFWTESANVGCGGTYAFVPVGSRMYVFVAWRNGNEPLVKAYLSTVRFQP